jgi:hypothetical protein
VIEGLLMTDKIRKEDYLISFFKELSKVQIKMLQMFKTNIHRIRAISKPVGLAVTRQLAVNLL